MSPDIFLGQKSKVREGEANENQGANFKSD